MSPLKLLQIEIDTSYYCDYKPSKEEAEEVRYFANCLRLFLRLDPIYQDGRAKDEENRRKRFGRPTNIKRARSIHNE